MGSTAKKAVVGDDTETHTSKMPRSGILGAGAAASSSKAAKNKQIIGYPERPVEAYKPFTELKQNTDEVIKALICRKWDTKNPKGRYLATEYVISDAHGNAMHCIARSSISHCVVPKLEIGNIYTIRRFTVQQNLEAYRVRRDDPFLIQLEGTTLIRKLECTGLGFHRQPFCLKPIEEIALNENKYLIDVIGRVINLGEVQPTRNGSQFLELHLINERRRSIKVTLWGSLGDDLIRRSDGTDALHVIVLPAMKIREYRGGIQLSSTDGTMIFDAHDIPEIFELRKLMGNGAIPTPDNNGTLQQLLELGREFHGQNQVPSATVKCRVKIVDIYPRSTWNYYSCGIAGCKKGLKPFENQLRCEGCAKNCDFPILRFRLRLAVSDESTTLVVTLFDDLAQQLIRKKATDIIQDREDEEAEYPNEVLELVGTSHVFEFKTHTYYNHGKYESFTVSKVFQTIETTNPLDNNDKGVQNEGFVQVDVQGNAPIRESSNEETTAAEEANEEKPNVTNTDSVMISKMPDGKNSVSTALATPAKTLAKRKLESNPDEEE